MSNRIVITGAGGQVGRRLAQEAAARGNDVLALSSAQWNIADQANAPDLTSGDVVINCAAYTNVDAAETDEAKAYAVNATGAGNVAQACARAGARLIHISTDYVFSGTFDGVPRPYEPDDATGPLSVYGRSKLDGEEAVLKALNDATVVRTSWVFTGTGNDFAAVMARKAAAGEKAQVVNDQTGSPTFSGDLVAALLQIVDAGVDRSIVHAGNAGAASRFDQARAVYAAVGADPELVTPVGTAAYPRPATRPVYSALGSRLSTEAGLTPLRPWQDALAEALTSTP